MADEVKNNALSNEESSRIIETYSLMAFARMVEAKHVLVAPMKHKDAETGAIEEFKTVVFKKSSNDKKGVIVNFSSNLGELTGKQLSEMKDDLAVYQLKVDDEILARRVSEGRQLESYRLGRKAESSWEEVDLGL